MKNIKLVRVVLVLNLGLLLFGCAASIAGETSERTADSKAGGPGSDLLLEAAGAKSDAVLLEPKIIGGAFASQGDDPWQVALIPANSRWRIAFCGGSLITPEWVLTAAHCVDKGTRPAQVDILSGSVNLDSAKKFDVKAIIVHPDWNPGTHDNDLALVKLSAATNYEGVPLATKSDGKAYAAATETRVSGWGATAMRGGTIRDLKYVLVPLVPQDDCNDVVSYYNKVTDNMLCAGLPEGQKDSCQGDSGGPLTAAANRHRILVGVVSWGEGCAKRNKYGVYTRLDKYTDWILANVR